MTQTQSSRQRASRYKRLANPPRMRLTDRDKQVVKAVNDFRVMRQDQVQRLLFPSKNTAQVRLWLLWQHKYLRRRFLPVVGGIQTSPVLYVLDRRGADLLKSEFGYDATLLRWSPSKRPGYKFLEHTLGLGEIRLALILSCRKHGYDLTTWLDEKAIKADYDRVGVGKKSVAVVPDAHSVIEVPTGKLYFFLEFDRGTEGLAAFKNKMTAYRAYCNSPKCKFRFGTTRIRVLTVTESVHSKVAIRRLANLKRITEEVGGRRRFWFSSLAQLATEDALTAKIWQVAGGSDPTALI